MRLGLTLGLTSAAPSGGGGGPVNTSPPVISGTVYLGTGSLTVTPGTWTGGPVLTYQWQRDGVDISGETSTTYAKENKEDVGENITCLEIPDATPASGVSSNIIVVDRYFSSDVTSATAETEQDATLPGTIHDNDTTDKLSDWDDNLGNVDGEQTSGAAQGSMAASVTIGGQQAIEFGVGLGIDMVSTVTLAGDFTVYAVVAYDNSGTGPGSINGLIGSGTNPHIYTNTVQTSVSVDGSKNIFNYNTAISQFDEFIWIIQRVGSTVTVYKGGSDDAVSIGSFSSNDFTFDWISNSATASRDWLGRMSIVRTFEGNMSDTEKNLMGNSARVFFGLTWTDI